MKTRLTLSEIVVGLIVGIALFAIAGGCVLLKWIFT